MEERVKAGSMDKKYCAICFKKSQNLGQHLNVTHHVSNVEERKLLLAYGSGRVNGSLQCPVCDKKNVVRLDRHLMNFHLCNPQEVEKLMLQSKRMLIVNKIAELRASNPTPALVCILDIDPMFNKNDQNTDGEIQEEKQGEVGTNLDEAVVQLGDITTNITDSDVIEVEATTEEEPTTAPRPLDEMPSTSFSQNTSGTSMDSINPALRAWVTASSNNSSKKPKFSQPEGKSCKGCAALALRVERLEVTMTKVLAEKASIFNPSPCVETTDPNNQTEEIIWSTPKKGGHSYLPLEGTFCGEVLDDFYKFRLGSRTSSADRENAKLQKSHVLRFMTFLLTTRKNVNTAVTSLRFLYNIQKLREYPKHLEEEGYAPTSIKNMLNSVSTFLTHVRSFHIMRSKLSDQEISALLYQLKRLQSEVYRVLAVHREKVRRQKTKNAVSASDELAFMKKAMKKIPRLLKKLKRMGRISHHHLVMGYMAGYLAILTGHRPVVLKNICKEDIFDATLGKKGRVVWVGKHKTDRVFGHARFALKMEEYKWLNELVEISNTTLNCNDCPFVFHTANGEQIKRLGSCFQCAWKNANLPGTVSFNLIRSSVSTQADRYLSEKERDQVARAMCHDPATAEKFYVGLPSTGDQFKVRESRMKALNEEAVESDMDSTSEDEMPPLQDTDTDELLSEESEAEDEDQTAMSLSDSKDESRQVRETNTGDTEGTDGEKRNTEMQENSVKDRAHEPNVCLKECDLENKDISKKKQSDRTKKNEKQDVKNESGSKKAESIQELEEVCYSQTCSPSKLTLDVTISDAKEKDKQMKETVKNSDEAQCEPRNEEVVENKVKETLNLTLRALKRRLTRNKHPQSKQNVLEEKTKSVEWKDRPNVTKTNMTKRDSKQEITGDSGDETASEVKTVQEKETESCSQANKDTDETESDTRRQRVEENSLDNDHCYILRKGRFVKKYCP